MKTHFDAVTLMTSKSGNLDVKPELYIIAAKKDLSLIAGGAEGTKTQKHSASAVKSMTVSSG